MALIFSIEQFPDFPEIPRPWIDTEDDFEDE